MKTDIKVIFYYHNATGNNKLAVVIFLYFLIVVFYNVGSLKKCEKMKIVIRSSGGQ